MLKSKHSILLILMIIGLVGFYSCHQKESISLKIMSYNIRHGNGLDNVQDLSRSAKIIASQAPDLCGLQEIDNFCLRSDSIGQTDYLAKKTSMTGTFSKFMDFDKGAYGMSTLSTKPIVSTKILKLPDAKYEPRISIINKVQITEGHTILFVNVHFDWVNGDEGSSNRLNQAKVLVKYLNKSELACVIVGDFNCTPESSTMQYFYNEGFIFVDKGHDKLSYQGEHQLEIDHLLFRDSREVQFEKKNVLLLQEPIVSDHRPLIVELEATLN
ncbi:MAG: hypothetical protein CMB82_07050 [Flammeovirgaceae bacterium]|nr:hypothetical protein [Flammeovirgaceae bacterium]